MRIQQLIFQGVCGYTTPVRLELEGDMARESLPDGISLEETHGLLANLLYPTQRPPEARDILDKGGRTKLALIFEVDAQTFRIARKKPQTSLGLQRLQGGESVQTLATGARDVAHVLDQQLDRPSFEVFRCLNLWIFEPLPEESTTAFDPDQLDEEGQKLVEQYRVALERESIQEQLEEIERELESLRSSIEEGLEAEERLEDARRELAELEITDLSEDDIELVQNRDARLERLDNEYERLADDEDAEHAKLDDLDPTSPWWRPVTWVGLALGVGAIGASLWYHDSWRWVVLLDLVGFGMVAWTILEYLTDLEAVNIHRLRLESIRRRLSEVRREKVDMQENIDHLIVHAGAEDEVELLEKHRRVQQLESVVESQQKVVREYRNDPEFIDTKERLEPLEVERDELERRRESLPDHVPDRYQIEMQFSSLGYEPDVVREALERQNESLSSSSGLGEGSESSRTGAESFERLQTIASKLDLWYDGALGREPRNIWQKIAGHLLGEPFQTVDLAESGEPTLEGENRRQFERWRQTHPEQTEVLASALALALHLTSVTLDNRIDTIWITDPHSAHSDDLASRFYSVFDNAVGRVHFVLLDDSDAL